MSQLDEVLIEEAKGDPTAFGELVLRYQDRLYNFLYRMTGTPEDAQDLTQETFLRIFKALPRYRPGAPFRPWMYKIATNVALTALKERRRTVVLEDEIPSQSLHSSPEHVTETRETQRAIHKAITELPEAYRAVILLRHVEELSYEEIAQTLTIPLGTAKVRLYRARLRLQEILRAAGVKNSDHEVHSRPTASPTLS